jgi:DNA-binding beta-propeller fold protein YncE
VPNYASGTLTVIDCATKAVSNVAAGNSSYAVAVNPATDTIYVTNYFGDNVTVINGSSNGANKQ